LNKVFDENCIDNIICMEMMEHIPPTQTMNVWKQFHRILKPGGTIILSIPYTEGLENFCIWCPICCEWIIESGHVRAYPPSVVEAEMKVNGFKLIESRRSPTNAYVYKAVKI
jgi:SAM-dependent methyltransferase